MRLGCGCGREAAAALVRISRGPGQQRGPGLCWGWLRLRARLAVLSVRVGRLDCDEARCEEEEEDGTCRHIAELALLQRG